MADDRKAIHAYLSPDAHEAWHQFAAEQGVSVSGLLEAIADHWSDTMSNGGSLSPESDGLARAARKIDAQRRRRRAPA